MADLSGPNPDEINGLDAHDAAITAKPVLVGGYASATAPTSVQTGDAVNAWYSLFGARNVILRDTSGAAVATGTQYTEDSVLGTATGTLVVARRDDALAALTPVEGDAVGLAVGSRGALWVQIADGSGNQITSFGGTQYVEDAALGATPTGTLSMARRTDTLATLTPVVDDAVSLRTSSRGALWVAHDGGLQVQGEVAHGSPDSGNPVKIGGKASTGPTNVDAGDRVEAWLNHTGAQAVFGGDAATLSDGESNTGMLWEANTGGNWAALMYPYVFNGSAWDRTRSGGVTGMQGIAGATAADSAIAAYPVTIGGRASNAVPTAMSADGDVVNLWADLRGRLTTKQTAGTATLTNVAASASSVTILAANTARLGATIVNDSTQVLYLKMGATASSTSYTVKLAAGAYYEVPFGYTGILDGIWASASGNARVTELT